MFLIILYPFFSNNREWVGGQPVCDYFSFMLIWAGLATVLVVGSMTLERVLAILYPYFYERHVSASKVKIAMAAIWIFAALVSSLPLFQVRNRLDNHISLDLDAIFNMKRVWVDNYVPKICLLLLCFNFHVRISASIFFKCKFTCISEWRTAIMIIFISHLKCKKQILA